MAVRKIKTDPCICGGEGEFRIDWYSGVDCKCYIECKRCGRRTKSVEMPWIAWEVEWNNHKYLDGDQMTIFDGGMK